MASLRVLAFDQESRPVQFDTWLDDLQLYLLSHSKDSVTLFDLASGAITAPPATTDSSTRSQWLTRDAAAHLAIRNHLPLAECAHFGQHWTAQALYDAVVARYSSPATAALGRLLLPYLFPELSAFATVKDLVSHLHASDARYRATVPAEFLDRNPPPMYITLYFIVTRLLDSLRSVREHFLSLDPTSLIVELLEQHLLAAETSAVADVGAASANAKCRSSKGKGGRGGGGGSGGGGGGSGSGGGGSSRGGGGSGTGGGSGGSGGGGGGSGGSGNSGGGGTAGSGTSAQRVGSGGGQRQQQQGRSENLSPQQLREWFLRGASGGSWPYVIRTGDHAGQTCGRLHTQHRCFSSLDDACAKGDCYRCVPPDPGIAAATLDASESGTLPGTAPAQALHTFTLDSGASQCFFLDSTTLTPLPTPVPVRLADPSGGLVVARSSTVLPCPTYHCPPGCDGHYHHSWGSASVDLHVHTDGPSPGHVHSSARVESIHTRYRAFSGSCVCLGVRVRSGSRLLLMSPPVAPDSPGSPLPTLPSWHAHSSSCLWSPQLSASPSAFACPALPPLRRGAAARRSLLLLVSLDDCSPADSPHGRRRIGLVMEVARTSMIHAAAPHFMWPFAVQYAAHQLNLWPRVSLPETSPTLRWMGKVGNASVFRVWGSRAFVRDTSGDKLSPHAIPCVFLGFVPDAPGWQFYHPTSHRILSSHDITFDKSVPFYHPLPGPALVQVAVVSGVARDAASGSAMSRGAEPGGAESEVAETGGAGPGGVATRGAEPGGAKPGGAASEGAESGGADPPSAASSGASGAGGAGPGGAGGAGVAAGADVTTGTATTGPRGARTRGTGAAKTGGVEGARAGDLTESGTTGAGGAGAGGAGVGGPGAGGAGVGGPGVGGAGAGAAGAVDPGGAVWPRPYFVPLLQQSASPLPTPSTYTEQSGGLTKRREPASCPVSPIRTARRVPPVPGTHAMTLRPSSVPLLVPMLAPPESSLPEVPNPESGRARAASPTVSRILATAITDPSFESAAAYALVSELLDFAAACRLDYATALVAESASASPPSVGGGCALGTVVLEDRQEDFECLAAAVPRFASMLLAPEGDPDAPDIPTLRSYAEAIMGPYSSQWQAATDVEMASWKSTGTYGEAAAGSPPAFNARYVARGFRQRQGVDYIHTFSPTLKMTTLRVLLHVAAQHDYELHSLDFNTAFLHGSLHEEIWLRRPPGFTESFPAGTQWSLRQPVYGPRQVPHKWHDTLRTTLAALGFAPATADPSLFLRTDTSLPPFYVLVYVDDLVFATADTEALTLVKSELKKRHTCTDLGELRSYLGLQITWDRAQRTMTLTQSHMVHQVLQRFGFQFSSPQPTPLSTSHSLSAPPSDESIEPSGPYPELVGCLVYLMTCTRPDLAYPLSLLACYVAPGRHRKVHCDAAKRVLRYLCSTSGMGLMLGGRGPVVLTCDADASWVDDLATQRSSQGYTFSLGSGCVSWRSTRSSSVLSSSCEAEIYAGAMAAQELRWLTYLLTDLGEQPRSPPVLYVDNKAMIALCQEHRLEHRTKHIALRYFLARELQQRGQLCLAYVATRASTADIFTQALPPGDHQRFSTVLGLLPTLPHLLTA
ncbi:unnamed protein product [Closterium sp. NIES-53]